MTQFEVRFTERDDGTMDVAYRGTEFCATQNERRALQSISKDFELCLLRKTGRRPDWSIDGKTRKGK